MAQGMIDEASLAAIVGDLFAAELIESDHVADLARVYSRVASDVVARSRTVKGMFVAGICGAQGSGKSTVAMILKALIERQYGLSVAIMSIDDVYLTAAERAVLANRVHPLLRTRGVPGTHDVALAMQVIDRMSRVSRGDRTLLPSFDKAHDDRRPKSEWPVFSGRPDIFLLEGWCVGARAQDAGALGRPVNALEAAEDADGTWRSFVNAQLERRYSALFDRLNMLILLQAPSFEEVYRWREEQEVKLARATGVNRETDGLHRLMDTAGLRSFIMHYERLTRHILAEMPGRASIVARLRPDRSVESLMSRP